MRIQDIPRVAQDPSYKIPVATVVGSFKRIGTETKFGPEIVFTINAAYASEVLRMAESRGRMVQIHITTTERGERALREPVHVDEDGNEIDLIQWIADLEDAGLGDLLNIPGIAATPADEIAAKAKSRSRRKAQ